MPKVRTIDATATDAGVTVQRLIHERLGVSNAEAKGLIASGCVERNRRQVAKPDERIAPGDRVVVAAEQGRDYRGIVTSKRGGEGWRVVHEDDDVLVVDKDAGVLTVPTLAPAGDSLEEMLLAAYKKRGHKKPTLLVVHRIDRFTSGLVVFARHHPAAMELKRQFKERTPDRIYMAVASGRVEPEQGRLTHALSENPKSLKVQVTASTAEGRGASLRYRVIERFPSATLIEVTLETGRRNQIRVQFAAEGHAIVGDVSYGTPSGLIDRVALHAHRLAFDAPRRRKRLQFTSPLPADMRKLIAKLKAGAPLLQETSEDAEVREEAPRRRKSPRPRR